MGLFRLLARVTIGLLFVGHGTQKLFGWFGGGGLERTAGFFEQLGFRPGRRYGLAAGAAEAGGVNATPQVFSTTAPPAGATLALH
jgi:putative oxidoreductase